jgi:hypothetical protein
MDLKKSVSASVSGRPSPAFRTIFQLSQLGAENAGPNSFGSSMVSMMDGVPSLGRVVCAVLRLGNAALGFRTVAALALVRGIRQRLVVRKHGGGRVRPTNPECPPPRRAKAFRIRPGAWT